MSEPETHGQVREQSHEAVSNDVKTVVEHLRNNRTTVHEAETIQEAARKSLVDHGLAKSMQRD